MFCYCFLFIFLFIFSAIHFRPVITTVYQTDLHQMCMVGRIMADVDDRSGISCLMPRRTLPWQPTFLGFIHRIDSRRMRLVAQAGGLDVGLCRASTPWVKKTRHQTLGHNFTNYIRSSKFFTSGLGSKFATNSCLNIPHALNMSLHYLVKCECRKMASFWNTYYNYWWITR